jgi:hypothetical protein
MKDQCAPRDLPLDGESPKAVGVSQAARNTESPKCQKSAARVGDKCLVNSL